jgi:opacity protein-like surface antigen
MIINRGSYLLGAVLGSAVVLALAPRALAADIYEPALKGGYEAEPVVDSDRGFYFKGYVGQANSDVGSIFTPAYNNNTFTVFQNDIKSSPLFGLGIGWRARHWLRFDLTGDYRGDAVFVAQDKYAGGFGFTAGTDEYTADVKTWLGLANVYWDIGTWCGFTPFLGAGIGFATVTVDGLRDVNVPVAGVAFGATNTNTNFAWALHAGVSYDVSPQLAIDLAYRYAQLGDGTSGAVTDYLGVAHPDATLHIRDIDTNDVMLGVRYKFNREEAVVLK